MMIDNVYGKFVTVMFFHIMNQFLIQYIIFKSFLFLNQELIIVAFFQEMIYSTLLDLKLAS